MLRSAGFTLTVWITVVRFGIHLAHSKCKMLFRACVGLKPNFLLGKELGGTDKFSRLSSCILSGGCISEKVFSCREKARLTFTKFKRLWRQRDIRQSIKGPVNTAVMKSVSLCGSQTRPLRTDMRRLSVSQDRYLHSIDRIWEKNFVSNSEEGRFNH